MCLHTDITASRVAQQKLPFQRAMLWKKTLCLMMLNWIRRKNAGCLLHAAIKFGQKDDLKELLERRDLDVNQVDSKKRTAADFAALCGEEDLLELIKSHDGKFHVQCRGQDDGHCKEAGLPVPNNVLSPILETL